MHREVPIKAFLREEERNLNEGVLCVCKGWKLNFAFLNIYSCHQN